MAVWNHDGRRYEVTSYYHLDSDAWHYELAGVSDPPGAGPFLVVSIPDASPGPGPFVPADADRAVVQLCGQGDVPWTVLRRFIDHIEASGDLIGTRTEPTG